MRARALPPFLFLTMKVLGSSPAEACWPRVCQQACVSAGPRTWWQRAGGPGLPKVYVRVGHLDFCLQCIAWRDHRRMGCMCRLEGSIHHNGGAVINQHAHWRVWVLVQACSGHSACECEGQVYEGCITSRAHVHTRSYVSCCRMRTQRARWQKMHV